MLEVKVLFMLDETRNPLTGLVQAATWWFFPETETEAPGPTFEGISEFESFASGESVGLVGVFASRNWVLYLVCPD